jgi:hypothetical protein
VVIIDSLWVGDDGGARVAIAVGVEVGNPIPSVNGLQGPFGPKSFFYILIVLHFFIELIFSIGYLKIIVVWSR